jgi:hypothetical protein
MIVTSPVRKATLADEPELMELCRQLHQENAMFAMNEDKVRGMLRRAFSGTGGIIGALGPTGGIQGAIYLLITSFWYSNDFCLEELYSFVLPPYRRSNNAKELVRFAKRCSTELGIPLVIGVVSNIRTQAKVELYRRQLADPIGAYFAYNLPRKDGENVGTDQCRESA